MTDMMKLKQKFYFFKYGPGNYLFWGKRHFPASIYLLKVNNETSEQSVKTVQS